MQKIKLKKKYARYAEYKDSGVEWIGRIPKDWRVGKVKEIFNLLKERSFNNSEAEVLSLTLNGIKTRDVSNNEGQIAASYEGYRKILKGDIILNPMDLLRGFVDASKFNGIISPAYSTLRKKDFQTDSQYYNYFFQKHYFEKILHPFGNGVSVDHRWTLKDNTLMNFPILNLPKTEQVKLAKYLDEKTEQIDKIIEKKEKLIELLREKKVSFIDTTINNITGASEKLKYIAPEKNSKIDFTLSKMKYLGMENIESNTGKYVTSEETISPDGLVNLFHRNDVLFGKLRPYLAKVFSPDFDGVCSGEFLVLKPKKEKILSRFLFYKLISRDFIKKVNESTYGTKMPRANWQFIGNQILAYPSLTEQKKIVAELDIKNELYDTAVQKVEQTIKQLRELKISLISNVVTGKVQINDLP